MQGIVLFFLKHQTFEVPLEASRDVAASNNLSKRIEGAQPVLLYARGGNTCANFQLDIWTSANSVGKINIAKSLHKSRKKFADILGIKINKMKWILITKGIKENFGKKVN